MKKSYREIRSKQIKDLKSKTSRYMVYRAFSTPFTYLFVRLDFSPYSITMLNFLSPLLGFLFLSLGTYASILIGLLFFVLFKILDCSDGEVARIRNPKAMDELYKSIEGPYFDSVGHFIYPIFLGMGLGIGFFRLFGSELYLFLGVAMGLLSVQEYSAVELIKSYLRKGIIDRKVNKRLSDKAIQNKIIEKIYEGKSWGGQNILTRIFGIYPFPGLVYTGEYNIIIIFFLIASDYLMKTILDFNLVFLGFTGLIALYLILYVLVRTIWFLDLMFKLKNKEYISKYIMELKNSN